MEEYAKLLNTILTKVVFNHMTMFFIFLFIGFTFIPPELTLYLNAKTPAFFPDWFTLANFGSLIFALVSTMIWILISNAAKSIFSKLRESLKTNSEQARLINLLYNLSTEEQHVLAMSCLNERIIFPDNRTQLAIEKLLSKELISYGWTNDKYELNPLIRNVVLAELKEHEFPSLTCFKFLKSIEIVYLVLMDL